MRESGSSAVGTLNMNGDIGTYDGPATFPSSGGQGPTALSVTPHAPTSPPTPVGAVGHLQAIHSLLFPRRRGVRGAASQIVSPGQRREARPRRRR